MKFLCKSLPGVNWASETVSMHSLMAKEYVKQATWHSASNHEAQIKISESNRQTAKLQHMIEHIKRPAFSVIRHKKHWEVVEKKLVSESDSCQQKIAWPEAGSRLLTIELLHASEIYSGE